MFTIDTPDGARLVGEITPAATVGCAALGSAGRLLIVHGLGEHRGRYGDLVKHLAGRGMTVARFDLRGHGASGGARGALPNEMALCADLGSVLDHLQADPAFAGPGPLLLLGHSLGGLIAARFVAEGLAQAPAPWWRPVDGLVLSSPALDAGMSGFQRFLVGLLGQRLPDLSLGNGLDAAWLSRDAAVVQAYRADPQVHDRITPRLARFILLGGQSVLQAAPRWRTRTLMLYAGADRCVAPDGARAFARLAPAGQVQTQEFPALFHEIFNEPERDQVLAALDHWIDPPALANGVTP